MYKPVDFFAFLLLLSTFVSSIWCFSPGLPEGNEKGTGCKSRTVPAAVIFLKEKHTLPLLPATGRRFIPEVSQKTCQIPICSFRDKSTRSYQACTCYFLIFPRKKARRKENTTVTVFLTFPGFIYPKPANSIGCRFPQRIDRLQNRQFLFHPVFRYQGFQLSDLLLRKLTGLEKLDFTVPVDP